MTLEEKLKKRVTAGSTSNTTSTRVIECLRLLCSNKEELSLEKSLEEAKSFSYQYQLASGEAKYHCNRCGESTISTLERYQDIEVEDDEVTVSHRWTENDGCLIQRTGWANYEGVTISITGKDAVTPVTFELTHEQAEMLKAVL